MTKAIFLVAMWLSIVAPARAQTGSSSTQTPNGEVRLEVKDPAGRPVEATGRLIALSTGASRNFETGPDGRYVFERLPLGRYRLEISKSGFADQSLLIEVESPAPATRTATLTVASLAFKVDVIAATPLPGGDLEPKEIPAPVQAATEREIEQSGSLDLSDFLNRRLSGVHINEIQGNPFQPDVNYRGYTASPLLGTPQGLSIYLDGVRFNQPFGDVVSWDLIPRMAIAEMALIPGSNPLFGLNTLGGAISVTTKDGRNHPGTAIQLGGGSFGRGTAEVEHGGSNEKGWHWYLGSSFLFENGWRDDSPSNVRQCFGKLGWQGARTTVGLTAAFANNSLAGNGLQEQRFLDRDFASVYTKPDITSNRSPFLNLTARHSPSRSLVFSGNVYYRSIRTSTFNGDINEDSLTESVYQPNAEEREALAEAGYTGFPTSGENASNTPFPSWRCIAQALLKDEPAEKCNGLINLGRSEQRNYGAAGQATWFNAPGGQRNRLTIGGAYDRSSVDFQQSTQLGYLNPDRSVTGVDAIADGVNGGEADGEPFDTRVDLSGTIQTGSFYATDTLSIGNAWNITLAGRYNRTVIDNRDRIRPGGGPGSLDGRHVFGRLNPAVGLTFTPREIIGGYASYNEGSRAPTSIELGCADPNQPCKLPNAMAGDPPLDQVVTRTFEAGLRGGIESSLSWSAGWFRADNRQDILFVASSQTGFGYFKNFGRTRRQGLKLDLNGRLGRVGLGGSYTFLEATFQSPEEVNGEANSSNDGEAKGLEGLIQIEPGAQIPLIPQHMMKAFADWQATSKLSLNLGLIALSSSFARGNENNLHEPDGEYYLGPGKSPGYAVVNLGARYEINRRLELFAQINNLFDRRYYTAAQLGPTGFTAAGAFIARPFPEVDDEYPVQNATFYAPGAPRGAWAGVRLKF